MNFLNLQLQKKNLEEIETALQKRKNKKSTGPDDILNELLTNGRETLVNQLTILFRKLLLHQRISDE